MNFIDQIILQKAIGKIINSFETLIENKDNLYRKLIEIRSIKF